MKQLRILCPVLALALLVGCAATTAPESQDSLAPVYADWSQLEDAPADEAPVYDYFQPYSGDGPLQSSENYGLLLPYVGAEMYVENYIVDRLPLYGLATADGHLVTEPVYAGITYLTDFVLLQRGSDTLYQQEDPLQERGDFILTVAAPDGSWVRDAGTCYMVSSGSGLLALGSENGTLTFWNTDGETVITFPGEPWEPYFEGSVWNNEGGPWLEWRDTRIAYVTAWSYKGQTPDGDFLRLYLDLETGEILEKPPAGYPAELSYDGGDSPEFPGYQTISSLTDPVTGKTYYDCRKEETGTRYLMDANGCAVWENFDSFWLGFPEVIGGNVAVWKGAYGDAANQSFSWYDLERGECILRVPIRSNTD